MVPAEAGWIETKEAAIRIRPPRVKRNDKEPVTIFPPYEPAASPWLRRLLYMGESVSCRCFNAMRMASGFIPDQVLAPCAWIRFIPQGRAILTDPPTFS